MKAFTFKGLADQAKAAGSKLAAATPTFEQLQAYRRTDESAPGLDASALAQLPPPQAIAVLQEQNAQLRAALLTERQKTESDDIRKPVMSGADRDLSIAERKLQSQAQRLEKSNTALKAKVDVLRSNLAEVRDDAERATIFEKQVEDLKEQLQQARSSAAQRSNPAEIPPDTGLIKDDGSAPYKQQLASLQQSLDEALAANRSAAQQIEAQAAAQETLQKCLGDAEGQAASAAATAADALNQQLESEAATPSVAGNAPQSAAVVRESHHQDASSHTHEPLEAREGALQNTSEQVATLQGQHRENAWSTDALQQQLTEMYPDRDQQAAAVSCLEARLAAASTEVADAKEQVATLQQQLLERASAAQDPTIQTEEIAAAAAVTTDLRLQLASAMQEVEDAIEERATEVAAHKGAIQRVNDLEAELSVTRTTNQERVAEAQERLAQERARCAKLEEDVAKVKFETTGTGRHPQKYPSELQNGSEPAAAIDEKAASDMMSSDAALASSAEWLQLEQRLADVQEDLTAEQDRNVALQENAAGFEASLAAAVSAANFAEAAAEGSNSELESRHESLAAKLRDTEDARSTAVAERDAAIAAAATEIEAAVAEADARAQAARAASSMQQETEAQTQSNVLLKAMEQRALAAEAAAESAKTEADAAGQANLADGAATNTDSTALEGRLRDECAAIRSELDAAREQLASATAAAAVAVEQAHVAERQTLSLQEQQSDRDEGPRSDDDEHVAALKSLQMKLAAAHAAVESANAAAASARNEASAAAKAQSQAESALADAKRDATREQEASTRSLNDAVAQANSGREALVAREESLMQLANQLEEIRTAARKAEDNEGRWASERQSLQERIQRLQKVNKDRRVELDEAHANLVVAKSTAQQVDSLRAKAAEVQPLQASLAAARSSLEAAEDRLQQEAASRREFLVKFQERSRAAVGEQQAVQRQLDEMREQLSASTAAAAEGAHYRGEAEAAREKSATHSATAARLKDQLRHAEGELDAALGTLDQERADHAHGLTIVQAQLDGLLDSDRSAWPASVRSIVESAETAAAEIAAAEARQVAEVSEAELEEEMDRLRSAVEVSKDALADALRAKRAAEEQSDRVVEDAQREAAAAAQQLAQAEAGFETRSAALQVQLDTADVLLTAAQDAREFYESQAEGLRMELDDVRERAQALMAEKDAQIEQAKMRWSSPRSQSHSPELPVSSILRHEDSMPLEKSRSVSFAEIQPASPTTPTMKGTRDSSEVVKLSVQLMAMQADLADRQHTESLRDQAAKVLKEEVDEMRRREKRNAVDLNYVKGVLVSGFESNELSVHSSMLPILARLLQFSPGDMQRLSATRNKEWLPPWQP